MILEEYVCGDSTARYLDLYGTKLYIPNENFKGWTAIPESVDMVGDDNINATRTNIEVVLRVDSVSIVNPTVHDLLTNYAENREE